MNANEWWDGLAETNQDRIMRQILNESEGTAEFREARKVAHIRADLEFAQNLIGAAVAVWAKGQDWADPDEDPRTGGYVVALYDYTVRVENPQTQTIDDVLLRDIEEVEIQLP